MRRTTTAAGAAVLTVLALAACTRQAEVESGPGSAPADTLEGTVRQVGNTPFVRTVVRGDEASATVVGELGEELARVSGARVRVWGAYREEGGGPGPQLEATGYEILSVDGSEPTVGVLHHDGDRGYYLATERGADVALAGVPDRLGAQVGGKVWVVLGENGGVQRYGVLREP